MKKDNNNKPASNNDPDINLDPNQDLSLLDSEVKSVPHNIKEDDYILEVKNLKMYFPISVSLFKTIPLKAVDDVSIKIRRARQHVRSHGTHGQTEPFHCLLCLVVQTRLLFQQG